MRDFVIGCKMDGARNGYVIKYEGDRCCKTMDRVIDSGMPLCDLTVSAKKFTGEDIPEVRFCPWCGWDNDKGRGLYNHRKKFEEDEEIDRIGASR